MSEEVNLREVIRAELKKMNSAPNELIWALGLVYKTKKYKEWGFKAFGDWVREDYAGLISPSYAYSLAKPGAAFYDQREEISDKLREGSISVRGLRDAAAAVNQGEAVETVISDLFSNSEKGKKTKITEASDPEKNARITVYIPQAEVVPFLAFLTKKALIKQVKTYNDITRDDYCSEELDQDVPERYNQYATLINEGRFFCAVCNQIPINPNMHHILKVSIGNGYGPQALLCEECHIGEVHGGTTGRDRFKVFLKKWGFDYEILKSEAEAQRGEIDRAPTEIVTGKFLNLRV